MGADHLANYIASYINRAKQLNAQKGIQQGQIQGNSVFVNGRLIPCNIAVDMQVSEGDYVYVYVSENGNAVVVGK